MSSGTFWPNSFFETCPSCGVPTGLTHLRSCKLLDRISQMETPRHVAIFILYRDGRALMESRPDLHREHQDPYWVYPGGKLKPGEQPVDAMRRECNEEILCVPQNFFMLSPVIGPNGWTSFPFIVTDWIWEVPSATVTGDLLAWWGPYVWAGESDGNTCVREIASLVVQQMQFLHTA